MLMIHKSHAVHNGTPKVDGVRLELLRFSVGLIIYFDKNHNKTSLTLSIKLKSES